MINSYRKSILSLLEMLHEARVKPFDNTNKWLLLQEKLIDRIIYVESRIRFSKGEISSLNKLRKNPHNRLTKEKSIEVKQSISYLQDNIEEYHFILSIYKSIGDAIAFTFIDKLDIKPQNFKESPGFISDKEGLRQERKYLRQAFKMGTIAILHDITSVLKYAGLTVLTPVGPLMIEAKSSSNNNPRLQRQEEKNRKIASYLQDDITENLYGLNGEMRRVELSTKEINYIKEFNNLLKKSFAKKRGFAYKKVEEGVIYCVAHHSLSGNTMPNALKVMNLQSPFMFMLNDFKFSQQAYYPFSLIFQGSELYWRFLKGEFVIMVLIDYVEIEKAALANGYTVQPSEVTDRIFRFDSVNQNENATAFLMSEHYFFRSFMELVSVNWLISEACAVWAKSIQSAIESSELVLPNTNNSGSPDHA